MRPVRNRVFSNRCGQKLILAVMLYFIPVVLKRIGFMEVGTVVKVMAYCALVACPIQWKFHFVTELFDHFIIRLKVAHFSAHMLGAWPMAIFTPIGNHMWRRV